MKHPEHTVLMLGIVLGLAIGLVFCIVAHAEYVGDPADARMTTPSIEQDLTDLCAKQVTDGSCPPGFTCILTDVYDCGTPLPWEWPVSKLGISTTFVEKANMLEEQRVCHDTMAAAMRAMDEFIYKDQPPIMSGTAIADMCIYDAVCMAERELARVQRRSEATRQWEKAKACWEQKP